MSRNTKEISLIQIRSGNMANLPQALHQAEFGLAKDTNRLFIGNAINNELAKRTTFPYQNLEILTEYSDLSTLFKYRYENNIQNVGSETDRNEYKEFLPIIIECSKNIASINLSEGQICEFNLNGYTITLVGANDKDAYSIIDDINKKSNDTHVYATHITGSSSVTFISFTAELKFEMKSGINVFELFGIPSEINANLQLPQRNIVERLQDRLYISDFGINGDGITNVSDKLFNDLLEIYKNGTDKQFFRQVEFPAGTYLVNGIEVETQQSLKESSIPMVSNMNIVGNGIDRTVFTSDYTTAPILASINEDLLLDNAQTTHYFKDGKMCHNILIQDVTFENINNIDVLASISGLKDVTFNRVKFKGSEGSNRQVLVKIFGNSNATMAENITFNECVFENGKTAIQIDKFAKNVTISNCQFINVTNRTLVIGSNDGTDSVYGVNITANTFTDCGHTGDSVIYMDTNSSYVSIHESVFDKDIIEKTGTVIPFIDNGTYNFCDTLDFKEDERKVLTFKFAQPVWKYLNYFCDENGKINFTVGETDTSKIDATNGINIDTTSGTNLVIETKTGNVTIKQQETSNLILGQGETEDNASGSIVLKKKLDLNGNSVTTDGDSDIVFETPANNVMVINSASGIESYNDTALSIDNAIPTVSMLKDVSTTSVIKEITSKDLQLGLDYVDIITFDPVKYGNDVRIKQVSVNVRKPFDKTVSYKSTCATYSRGLVYNAGDVVKGTLTSGTTAYGVVNKFHNASGDFAEAFLDKELITELPENDGMADFNEIRFVDVIAKEGNDEIPLTQEVVIDGGFRDVSNPDGARFSPVVDLYNKNFFGFYGEDFDPDQTYNGEELLHYQGKSYQSVFETPRTLTPTDLHNPDLCSQTYYEGYNYLFDMDKNLGIDYDYRNLSMLNVSGKKLSLKLYGEQDNRPIHLNQGIVSKNQLNAGGSIVVRIDFFRVG